MPKSPLSGVRSSWLMLARKFDLALLAASAASLAARRACSESLRSVMSREKLATWRTLPSALVMGNRRMA